MNPDRRRLLAAGAAGAGAVALSGCERAVSSLTARLGHRVPDRLDLAAGPAVSAEHHLLARAGFGPWPGETEVVRERGAANWLEEQLHPADLDDTACNLRANGFESLHLPPGDAFEFKRPVILEELGRHALLRAVYSRRRLLETLTVFWTDHFNVDTGKGDVAWLKTSDDRDVVRRHALGNFRDLLRASVLSPAMLVYLDGTENRVRRPGERPNENFARELLELHTLGVDAGYTQGDVMETARALSGWHLRGEDEWSRGAVEFRPGDHDDGEKRVLGRVIPAGGGEADLDRLLAILWEHPATPRFVARKLVRRFVAHEPPADLVAHAAAEFRATDGSIPHLVRAVIDSDAFRASAGRRVRRPFGFLVAALRALAADTHAPRSLLARLRRLGQAPFEHPTPDGYPDDPAPWMGTLLWRWNVAVELATGRLPGVRVDLGALVRAAGGADAIRSAADLAPVFLGREATAAERAAVEGHAPGGPAERDRFAEGVGLLLAAPAFQQA